MKKHVSVWNAFSLLNANRLAEVDTNSAIPNTAVWHNSITENSLLQICSLQHGFSQVSVSQTRTPQINSSQVGFGQVSSTELSVVKFRSPQISFGQVSTFEISPAQYTFPEISTSQIGAGQIGTVQSSVTQVSSPQNSTLQKELFQPSATQVSTSQIESVQVSSQFKSGEVSFPSSIPSFDFVSIDPDHNWFTQSVYTINNSAIAFWDFLLKPQTAFDINLLVKDLPTEQLAEAQITKYDSQGRPIGSNIFIDSDANGKGWFIDSTPLDNSEFVSSNAANYFQADTNSAAYGKIK